MVAAVALVVVVAQDAGPLNILTAALVALTGFYAIQTRATVLEMRRDRELEARERRWQRVDAAARALLVEFNTALIQSAEKGVSEFWENPELLRRLSNALHSITFEIDDEELRRRLSVCHMASQPATWGLRLVDRRASGYLLFDLIQEVRRSLQQYVRRDRLPDWPTRFPDVGDAQNWIKQGKARDVNGETEK